MHPQTGEIKSFESEIPEDWVGLDHLAEGETLVLHSLKFKIIKSVITPGKPGKVELMLEGVPNNPFEGVPTTQNFRDSMKAFKYRTSKKDWE